MVVTETSHFFSRDSQNFWVCDGIASASDHHTLASIMRTNRIDGIAQEVDISTTVVVLTEASTGLCSGMIRQHRDHWANSDIIILFEQDGTAPVASLASVAIEWCWCSMKSKQRCAVRAQQEQHQERRSGDILLIPNVD